MAGTVSVEAQRLTASAVSVESREVQALLVVLSVTAGCTDIISFLGLNGLFTAHITGNLVILAAHFFSGESQMAPMLTCRGEDWLLRRDGAGLSTRRGCFCASLS
jgi:hypothetical protein